MPPPVLAVDVTQRPHAYDPDPRDTSKVPHCKCGMTRSYRSHQPLWWRWLFPGVKWR